MPSELRNKLIEIKGEYYVKDLERKTKDEIQKSNNEVLQTLIFKTNASLNYSIFYLKLISVFLFISIILNCILIFKLNKPNNLKRRKKELILTKDINLKTLKNYD